MSLFGWKSSRPLARTPGDVGPRKRRPVLAECLRQVADNNFCRGPPPVLLRGIVGGTTCGGMTVS